MDADSFFFLINVSHFHKMVLKSVDVVAFLRESHLEWLQYQAFYYHIKWKFWQKHAPLPKWPVFFKNFYGLFQLIVLAVANTARLNRK